MITTPGFSELNAVLAVAARKSFRAAASELGVSASAVSHTVASLEASLGVRLFNRTTRSVSITPDGERFLEKITPAMRAITDAMQEANDRRATPAGSLRISMAERTGEMLSPLVQQFLAKYQDVKLEIITSRKVIDIVAEGYDAGVRLRDMVPLNMVAVPLGATQRHVVVAAPLYLQRRVAPQSPLDLRDHDCIRYRLPTGIIHSWSFQNRDDGFSIELEGPLTVDNDRLVLQAALTGVGIAYLNEWSARDALRQGTLVQLLPEWTPPYPGLCLYYPKHRHTPAVLRAFIEMARITDLSTSDVTDPPRVISSSCD